METGMERRSCRGQSEGCIIYAIASNDGSMQGVMKEIETDISYENSSGTDG